MLTVFYGVLLFFACKYITIGLIGLSVSRIVYFRVACFLQGNSGFAVGSAREILSILDITQYVVCRFEYYYVDIY